LYDVDTIAGTYQDQVQIFLNGSGTVAATGAGKVFPTVTLGPGATVTHPNAALATFVGGSNVAGDSTAGNVALTSDTTTAISTVTIKFTDVLGAVPGSIQWVGIGDLSFCPT
jgi:hypothetical protein